MDEEEKVVLDYVSDPLIMDKNFCSSILSSIAQAGHAIEELYGSPQDIEGVVKDGKIYVVQTRPQMWLIKPPQMDIEGIVKDGKILFGQTRPQMLFIEPQIWERMEVYAPFKQIIRPVHLDILL